MSDRHFDADCTELAQRMLDDVRGLSRDGPGVTRPSYSDIETGTLAYLAQQAAAAGLETAYDLAGNL